MASRTKKVKCRNGGVCYPRPQRVSTPRENSNSCLLEGSSPSTSTSQGECRFFPRERSFSRESLSLWEKSPRESTSWMDDHSPKSQLTCFDESLDEFPSISAPGTMENVKAKNEVMRIMSQTEVLKRFHHAKVMVQNIDDATGEVNDYEGVHDNQTVGDLTYLNGPSIFENFRSRSVAPPPRPTHPFDEIEAPNCAALTLDDDYEYDAESSEEEFILDPLVMPPSMMPPSRAWSVR